MGTRIKKNPKLVYEVFCEIGIPTDSEKEPWIAWKYPYNFKNTEILKSLPGFAYPCEFSNNAVQHFSFVLTNIDSQWTFGFCRQASNSSTCYVILSYLPWHEVFYKILNHVAELTNKAEAEKCKNLPIFLENLYHAQIPDPGLQLHVISNKNEDFLAVSPDCNKLPSIPENRNLTEYFNAVDAQNMMIIFASMLHERRILISSKKLSRLSACVQAANALIYPMHWQHIFIPVLPKHLSDYLSAPMPFLIGIPATTLTKMKLTEMGDIVYLDADENKIETPFEDLDALPSEVLQSLRHDLKHPQDMLGDAVSRAFLRALVKLIGGYWNALKLRQGEKITFHSELFVQSRPPAMQPFLQKMLELQIFQQFIESRLKKLNAGQGVNDEFEFELTSHEDKASFRLRNQYRDWVSNMKKEGGAFFKNVKTKVRVTSKKAYKDIRSRIYDTQNHTTIHNEGPEVPKRRGSVPTSLNGLDSYETEHPMVKHIYKKEILSHTRSREIPNSLSPSSAETNTFAPISPVRKNAVESPQLTFQPIDVDLMGDLHDVIFRSCSICNNSSRSSVSDPQLIDLSLDEKVPCGPDCIGSPFRKSTNILEPTPPPRLPRPPSSKSKLTSKISTSSEPCESITSKPLIELDSHISHSAELNDLFSLSAEFCSKPIPSRSTNPFYQPQGPSVKNMVNKLQGTTHEPLSLSAEGITMNGTTPTASPYRFQALSRTTSTPPFVVPGFYSEPINMTRLKSASKVTTNPFVVADTKNNNFGKENLSDNSSTGWENFP
ncbi:hypothetical protein JTE90_017909 [Oedothorax gibbosus]|uniref:UDENN domain-containing protein n=1 Tax=Oedothorax gibbosus TaxID=931172 RepID=A0AAV6VFZ2_9ARAC|nr:hypothetical protein JTE90_017909 [Oedothorax gibbosus]